MPTNEFEKYPSETYPIGVDYTGKAPSGAVLSSGVWTAEDTFDSSDASTVVLLTTSAIIDGMVAKCRVKSGTLNKLYKLGITATFDTGDVLHDNVYMRILEEG